MTASWRRLFQLPPAKRQRHRIHLVGIGGTGLAPIANVLLELGYQVSGSDRESSIRTEVLAAAGATIHLGHDASNLIPSGPSSEPDLVLISSGSTSPPLKQYSRELIS